MEPAVGIGPGRRSRRPAQAQRGREDVREIPDGAGVGNPELSSERPESEERSVYVFVFHV